MFYNKKFLSLNLLKIVYVIFGLIIKVKQDFKHFKPSDVPELLNKKPSS